MEGERKKKRKMDMEEEEENEEEKIEKFFALIKSTRQVCEMLKGSSNLPWKKKDEHVKSSTTWNPAFQPTDFLDEDDKATSPALSAGPSKIQVEEEKKKEEDKEGNDLDLKLSL